jgi:hypothetical protein
MVLLNEGKNFFRDGKIPGSNAVGFEERDLGVVFPAGSFYSDELGEFVDIVPALGVLLEANDEIAGFLFGLREGVDEDEICFGDGGDVEFLLMGMIGADSVDVNAVGQILASQDGMGRSGGGGNDFGGAQRVGRGFHGIDVDAKTL